MLIVLNSLSYSYHILEMGTLCISVFTLYLHFTVNSFRFSVTELVSFQLVCWLLSQQ